MNCVRKMFRPKLPTFRLRPKYSRLVENLRVRGRVRWTVRSGEDGKRNAPSGRLAPDGSQDEGALSQVGDPEDVQDVFLLWCEPCLCLRRKGKKK